MKSFKKLLSVMLLGVLLVTNVVSVSAAEVQSIAPAPALTEFYVYSVSSEKAGEEIIASSGVTTLEHGGTWLRIVTIESGYAKSRSATFNGESMTLTDKQAIDIDNDGIIDGWICIWEYRNSDGFESGICRFILTSANAPWNTINVTFSIY